MFKQYWLVGAHWNGDDMYDTFIRENYWEMGYGRGDKPMYDEKCAKIKKGDRIAIKTRLGQGSSEIRIRAIGNVQKVDDIAGRIDVKWILTQDELEDRKVPSKGCLGTIHGPYTVTTERVWLGNIFRI